MFAGLSINKIPIRYPIKINLNPKFHKLQNIKTAITIIKKHNKFL